MTLKIVTNCYNLIVTDKQEVKIMLLSQTPPMGWNSWNTFGPDVNEKVILDAVDFMVEKGYKDAGYEYVVIDDCWLLMDRDENDRLVPDPEKFPHGIKYVADYIHERGLKFGMYSCAGTRTCARYPSSYNHEYIDAKTFAEWEIDFLNMTFVISRAWMISVLILQWLML